MICFSATVEEQTNFLLKSGETAQYQTINMPGGSAYTLVNINSQPYLIFDSNAKIVNDSSTINQVMVVANAGSSIVGDVDKLRSNLTHFDEELEISAYYASLTNRYDRSGCIEVLSSPVYMNLLVMYGPPIRFKKDNITDNYNVMKTKLNDSLIILTRIRSTASGAPYPGMDADVTALISNLKVINNTLQDYIFNCSQFMYGFGNNQRIPFNNSGLNNSFVIANSLKGMTSTSVSTGAMVVNRTRERIEYVRVKTLVLEAESDLNATKQLTAAVLSNVGVKRIVSLIQSAENKLSEIKTLLPTNASGAEALTVDLVSMISNLNFTATKILPQATELNKFIIALNEANSTLANAYKQFGETDDRLSSLKDKLIVLDAQRLTLQAKVENYENVDVEEITKLKENTLNITATLRAMKPKEMEMDPLVIGGVFIFILMIVGFVVYKQSKKKTM